MKRALPVNEQVDVSSDESSSSNAAENEQTGNNITAGQVVDQLIFEGATIMCASNQMSDNFNTGQGVEELFCEDALLRRAKMYQEYMQMVPMPTETHSLIPCNSWRGLAASMKTLYGQPLHYLTNLRMKELDEMRIEADNEDNPLDMVIHPTKAESCIWLMEEIHRRTLSPSVIAKLWVADPMYHVYIDAIFPKLQNPSK